MSILCRVIAFWSPDTARDLVTLTFDFLTLNSCHTWRVTWPTLPPSMKTRSVSVLELWVITFPVGYHWKYVRSHCACAESREPWVGGQKRLHFWNPRPLFAYSLFNFYWPTTTIKGRLLSSVTNAKALDCVIFRAWPCDRELFLFNLQRWSYMAGHMVNHSTKFEDPTTIRSWVTSYNASRWLPLPNHVNISRKSITITFLESPTPIYLFTMQLLLGSDYD